MWSLCSVVMSHATCDSSPHSRSWRSWASDNFSKAKGLLVYTLLCSLGIASFPEVAAACKRFAKSIALKMSIVFPVVFRKLLPTSCRCASRPSPAVPTVTLLGIPIASFKLDCSKCGLFAGQQVPDFNLLPCKKNKKRKASKKNKKRKASKKNKKRKASKKNKKRKASKKNKKRKASKNNKKNLQRGGGCGGGAAEVALLFASHWKQQPIEHLKQLIFSVLRGKTNCLQLLPHWRWFHLPSESD